jgi:hypothetical protein
MEPARVLLEGVCYVSMPAPKKRASTNKVPLKAIPIDRKERKKIASKRS